MKILIVILAIGAVLYAAESKSIGTENQGADAEQTSGGMDLLKELYFLTDAVNEWGQAIQQHVSEFNPQTLVNNLMDQTMKSVQDMNHFLLNDWDKFPAQYPELQRIYRQTKRDWKKFVSSIRENQIQLNDIPSLFDAYVPNGSSENQDQSEKAS